MTPGRPFKTQEAMMAEIEQLRQENDRLRQANRDLEIALSTTAEHGDLIECELHETNLKLQAEVVDRVRAQATLQALLELISQQKDDLELIVQTIMEHGDVLDVQWEQKLHEAAQRANYDSLTQLANRRRFDEYLEQQWHQMTGQQRSIEQPSQPLSLILCDIDHFKQYNDTYGHLAGDRCLKQVAQALNAALERSTDLLARYGGEEFAAILPQTSLDGALLVAERMRSSIQQLAIAHSRSESHSVITISLGVACVTPPDGSSSTLLLEEADRSLYLAKQSGRNQVVYTRKLAQCS